VEAAARRLSLYLRMPDWMVSPEKQALQTRAAAVGVLVAAAEADGPGADEPRAALKRLLRTDRNPEVRALSLHALAFLSRADRAAVEKALADEHEGVRSAAVLHAARLGMIGVLRRAARDPGAQVRRVVAFSLTQPSLRGLPEVCELLGALAQDGEQEVRGEAGLALAAQRDARAVPLLVEALGSGERRLRAEAEEALEDWFHQRFRDEAFSDGAVADAWGKWWEANEPHIGRCFTLTVRAGDTLSEIASAVYGTSSRWREIQAANGGVDPMRLPVGTKLRIPATGLRPVTGGE
jgi:nucleoid-associated protein YgaU